MTLHDKPAHQREMLKQLRNHQEEEDKSSLEAAAEAAAKVNAMLIAKGMLKPNQVHSGMNNIITKKVGGNNSLVAEVEINNLPPPCRNTLTRGTTQEEISKASGAAVTTRGRFMGPDEKAINPRDRCLYLNVQASTQESVDIAVQKINEIIKSMGGSKLQTKHHGMGNSHRGSRFRPPLRQGMGSNRMAMRGQNNHHHHHHHHPPPLMSLPTPPPSHLQLPPAPQPQPQLPPATVTIMQEKLYVGLEHAPPNFDTKNKLLGPGGSYLQHIQAETGAGVSLRGKSSGFMDLNGADSFEPMHIHIEHPSLIGLQEAKKLAENLIQTVQQSYVSFQQALAAMPPSMPTGLITGVPQQSHMMDPQLAVAQPGLAMSAVPEQSLQALQPQVHHVGPPPVLVPTGSLPNQLPAVPQAIYNSASGPAMVIPSSMNLNQVPIVSSLPVSVGAPILQQQPAPMELGGPVLFSQQVPQGMPPPGMPPPVGMMPQVVQSPAQPPHPIPAPVPAPMGPYAQVQPSVQLVSQSVSMAPPPMVHQQQGPPMVAQAQPPGQTMFAPQPVYSLGMSMSHSSAVAYTVSSSGGHPYYSAPKEEEPKRRFTEEKDDKIPENLLGYQHGPPHLVNLVRSSPPPQPVPPPISQPMVPPPGAQLIQGPPPHGLMMGHLPPDQAPFNPLRGQTIIHPAQSQFMPPANAHGQQIFTQAPSGPYTSQQIISGPPPPHLIGHLQHIPGPSSSPRQPLPPPNSTDMRPPGGNASPSPSVLMPPPPPPSSLGSPSAECGREEEVRGALTSKSPSNVPWDSGQKRKVNSSQSEPEKKKIKGILKNTQNRTEQQEREREDTKSPSKSETSETKQDDQRHPASPQYQGQPLHYPNMPSDPNLPPQSQEAVIHPPRLPHPSLPTNLLPSHHLVQPSDPNLPSQVHLPIQHPHLEGPRHEGPPTAQIVIEHAVLPGTPIHIAHHRPTTPAQIHHLEHSITGVPPPRQLLLEHPNPPPGMQMEHQAPAPGHPEHLQGHLPPPTAIPAHPTQPPPQEVVEFEFGMQQVPPSHPQFHNFDHVAVAPTPQQEQPQQQLIAPGSAVMVSSAHYPQYSIAISNTAPPPVSFAVPSSSTPFPIHSQPMQRVPDQQMLTAPPPPPSSYNLAMPPTSSSHFPAHFSTYPPSVQGQMMQQPPPPPPPPTPVTSQAQFQPQPQPQGIPYWVSQA